MHACCFRPMLPRDAPEGGRRPLGPLTLESFQGEETGILGLVLLADHRIVEQHVVVWARLEAADAVPSAVDSRAVVGPDGRLFVVPDDLLQLLVLGLADRRGCRAGIDYQLLNHRIAVPAEHGSALRRVPLA